MELDRFVAAQSHDYAIALAELRAGEKRHHWMWYVFPQIAGLGRSATARHYAITDLAEARAYLAHPLLGPRYIACVTAIAGHGDRSADAMLGSVDAMKLRSSLTLFAAAGGPPVVAATLNRLFGSPDPATLALIAD